MPRIRQLIVAFCCIALYATAVAQLPYIAPEVYQQYRSAEGNRIRFCIWEPNITSEFDEAVATAIADVLLLEPTFYSYEPDPNVPEEAFWSNVLILLTEHCSVLVGFNLVADAYPDWLTASRPYFRAPYVFAVADDGYERFTDIPRDRIIGSMVHTDADLQLTSYLRTLPEDRRWRRFPYGSTTMLLSHVEQDVVAAGLAWEPQLEHARRTTEAFRELTLLDMDPIPTAYRSLGFVMRAEDTFTRTMLDEAIVALSEDGTLSELIDVYELPGDVPPM